MYNNDDDDGDGDNENNNNNDYDDDGIILMNLQRVRRLIFLNLCFEMLQNNNPFIENENQI